MPFSNQLAIDGTDGRGGSWSGEGLKEGGREGEMGTTAMQGERTSGVWTMLHPSCRSSSARNGCDVNCIRVYVYLDMVSESLSREGGSLDSLLSTRL